MIDKEIFRKVKEYQELGISKNKVSQMLGIYYNKVTEIYNKSEEEYFSDKINNSPDQYRGYILDIIKFYPQIKDSVIWYRLGEEFPNHELKRATFYRYMKRIREECGFVNPNKRIYKLKPIPKAGEEAQVDFGQFKMKDMYGKTVRVYFFCMVMMYSNMKFVYFSIVPFKAETAIKAHDYAFTYFGGVPSAIRYDHDRCFVVSENFGDIIFVKEFEEYVRFQEFSVILCRPNDPESKGLVENTVGVVKTHFLTGKEFSGINCLNSDALIWLDNIANVKINATRKYNPSELFDEERKFLHKLKRKNNENLIVTVDKFGMVKYKGNQYSLPIGRIMNFGKVRIENENDQIFIYDSDTGDFICKHQISDGFDDVVKLENDEVAKSSLEKARIVFKCSEIAIEFLEKLDNTQPRYSNAQARRIMKLTRFYSVEDIIKGMDHCLKIDKIHVIEVQAFLFYLRGEGLARKYQRASEYIQTRDRGNEIRGMYYGKY